METKVPHSYFVLLKNTDCDTAISGFSIEGPSQAKIDCKDNGDGSADVTYWPLSPGEYAVHVLCNEQDIPDSPYMAQVVPEQPFDASRVNSPNSFLAIYVDSLGAMAIYR